MHVFAFRPSRPVAEAIFASPEPVHRWTETKKGLRLRIAVDRDRDSMKIPRAACSAFVLLRVLDGLVCLRVPLWPLWLK